LADHFFDAAHTNWRTFTYRVRTINLLGVGIIYDRIWQDYCFSSFLRLSLRIRHGGRRQRQPGQPARVPLRRLDHRRLPERGVRRGRTAAGRRPGERIRAHARHQGQRDADHLRLAGRQDLGRGDGELPRRHRTRWPESALQLRAGRQRGQLWRLQLRAELRRLHARPCR